MKKKKNIHSRTVVPFYHAREVWWCCLGLNVGSEQDGSGQEYYRPVLVLKGLSRHAFMAVPLTSSSDEHQLRPPVGQVEGKEARGLLSQIRVLDTKRLIRKAGYLNKPIFEEIRKAVKGML